MNKKRIIIGSIVVLLLSTIFHSVYDKFPSTITALFFPVNESIWEHNKMILLAFFTWSILESIFSKPDRSVFYQNLITLIICIILLDLTFTPFYLYVLNAKDNIIITIIWYAISIVLSFIIGEKFFTISPSKSIETNSLIAFGLISIIFIILTYNPLKLPIFYDYQNKIYGLK